MSTIEAVPNYYESMDPKYLDKQRTYKSFNKVQIQIPFTMLIGGTTGSFKTNCLRHIFQSMMCFTKVYLFAKDLEEPFYREMIDKLEEAGKKVGKQLIVYSDDIKDLVFAFDKNDNSILIVDDMICEKVSNMKAVEECYIRGRKKNVSSVFIVQNLTAKSIPQNVIKNANYVILKKINNSNDLSFILRRWSVGESAEHLKQMYEFVKKTGPTNFFMIDLKTSNDDLRFRCNFTPIKV